jgi:protein-disulfide isomerase
MVDRKGSLFAVILAALAMAAGLIAASQLSARQTTVGPTPSPREAEKPPYPPTAQPIKGDPDAPVTILEFSDFYCSFCARFLWEVFPRIESEYIAKGLVRYEFRNFTVYGTKSLLAAIAGECAQAQGKFWDFHDKLFELSSREGMSPGTGNWVSKS